MTESTWLQHQFCKSLAGRCYFGCVSLSISVWGLTRSENLFANFIFVFLFGIAAGQTNFKFQTFAKP